MYRIFQKPLELDFDNFDTAYSPVNIASDDDPYCKGESKVCCIVYVPNYSIHVFMDTSCSY